jgi:uncharacterized membrane protein
MILSIKEIVLIGLFASLTFIATSMISLQVGFLESGFVHLGTTVAVIALIVAGTKVGMISAAIGMSLFNLLSVTIIWAPATFIARLGMGYIMGRIIYSKDRNGENIFFDIVGLICGGLFFMIVMYLYQGIVIANNMIVPAAGIPGNITQLVLAGIIGIPIGKLIKKYLRLTFKEEIIKQ